MKEAGLVPDRRSVGRHGGWFVRLTVFLAAALVAATAGMAPSSALAQAGGSSVSDARVAELLSLVAGLAALAGRWLVARVSFAVVQRISGSLLALLSLVTFAEAGVSSGA